MKNTHVLPTSKPSRLIIYSTLLNEFRLLDEPIEDWKHKRHIYITSDEEIKKGDWFIGFADGSIPPFVRQANKSTVRIINRQLYKKGTSSNKKIILTTDQDLIKDGVQEIEDEFLEWFVKHSSCEYVKVEKYKELGFAYGIGRSCFYDKYKIIIPKEEPKQDLEKEMFELEQELDIPSHLRWHNSKPKQETLEEASIRAVKSGLFKDETLFNAGAKWQQKRMYSEEDLKQFAFECVGNFLSNRENELEIELVNVISDRNNKLFEKFKKK